MGPNWLCYAWLICCIAENFICCQFCCMVTFLRLKFSVWLILICCMVSLLHGNRFATWPIRCVTYLLHGDIHASQLAMWLCDPNSIVMQSNHCTLTMWPSYYLITFKLHLRHFTLWPNGMHGPIWCMALLSTWCHFSTWTLIDCSSLSTNINHSKK